MNSMKQSVVTVDLEVPVKIKETVPIYHKYSLTFEEAAEYFNIGINRLRMITSEPNCDFVLFVGSKRLIKRKKFEEYLDRIDMI